MISSPVLSAVFFIFIAASCSRKEQELPMDAAIPVRIAPVRQESIKQILQAEAIIYPREQSAIMPKIAAPVQAFYVNRGDWVKAGQLLATLENRDLSAAVAESKGQLEQAESNLRATSSATVPEAVSKAQTDLLAAQQTTEAANKLLENRLKLFDQGALARKLVDDAQVSYTQARSQFQAAQEHLRVLQSVGKQEDLAGAQAQVEAARAHYNSALAQLSYSEVKSPISGVVADRPLHTGEMTNTGTPLITIVDISAITARANFPQNQVATIKVGNKAMITQADSQIEAPGIVTVVSPATDPASTTIQIWIQFENFKEQLKPGTAAHVAITTAVIPNAIVIPSAALLPSEDSDPVVLVITKDSIAHQRQVAIGVKEDDKVQVLSGVSPGEQVVIAGGVGIEDKAKVRVIKPELDDK